MVAGGRPDTRKRCAVTVDRMMCESRRPRAYSTIISTIIANWWMRGCGARIDNYWARFAIDGERPRLTSDDEPSGRAASRSAGPSAASARPTAWQRQQADSGTIVPYNIAPDTLARFQCFLTTYTRVTRVIATTSPRYKTVSDLHSSTRPRRPAPRTS